MEKKRAAGNESGIERSDSGGSRFSSLPLPCNYVILSNQVKKLVSRITSQTKDSDSVFLNITEPEVFWWLLQIHCHPLRKISSPSKHRLKLESSPFPPLNSVKDFLNVKKEQLGNNLMSRSVKPCVHRCGCGCAGGGVTAGLLPKQPYCSLAASPASAVLPAKCMHITASAPFSLQTSIAVC